MKAKIYALYKGDTNICDGTIAQIAKRLQIKPQSVSYLTTPAYVRKSAKSKTPENRLVMVLIDE